MQLLSNKNCQAGYFDYNLLKVFFIGSREMIILSPYHCNNLTRPTLKMNLPPTRKYRKIQASNLKKECLTGMSNYFFMQCVSLLTHFFSLALVFIFLYEKIVCLKFLKFKFMGVRRVAFLNLHFTCRR